MESCRSAREKMCATQPYIGSRSLACASYDKVTAASQRSLTGRCMRSFEALLAPKTLWIAAKCVAPCSWQKYGTKMQPFTHFLRRNLHAPHGLHLRGTSCRKQVFCVPVTLAEIQEAVLQQPPSPHWVQAAYVEGVLNRRITHITVQIDLRYLHPGPPT